MIRPSDPSAVRPLRIHFDLEGQDRWHRIEWERRLGSIDVGGGSVAQLVNQAGDADCIVATSTPWTFSDGGRVFGRLDTLVDKPPRFVWDAGDHPAGREPGFYCSLPRSLFDPRRHRTFCYPLRYNECVQPADLGEARVLYGFVGGVTSGLRARLFATLRRHGRSDEMDLVEHGGPWDRMFDRSGISAKEQYAAALRRSQFVLCPRGNGVGSVRMFETMQSARVPVIISDDYVPPAHLDWDACSVRIRERDLERLPAILRERAEDWPRLAVNARAAWEQHFSDAALLRRLALDLDELLSAPVAESPWQTIRLARHWVSARGRRIAGQLLRRLDPRRVSS